MFNIPVAEQGFSPMNGYLLRHMVTRCNCFVNQRTYFINELYISCEYCYGKYTSEGIVTFILKGWEEHSLINMGTSIVTYLSEIERRGGKSAGV